MIILEYTAYPNMSLIQAIRMTSCIPGFLKPPMLDDKECYDGGVLNNYMITYFPPDETLGIYLGRTSVDKPVKV
jgi:predicted acylesterase/phospholipase RssA